MRCLAQRIVLQSGWSGLQHREASWRPSRASSRVASAAPRARRAPGVKSVNRLKRRRRGCV